MSFIPDTFWGGVMVTFGLAGCVTLLVLGVIAVVLLRSGR